MKRRQLSKKTLATLAMMGLISSVLVPATATAAQNNQPQQQRMASAGCGSCHSQPKPPKSDDNTPARTRRYNPNLQTADNAEEGTKSSENGNHSCSGSTGANGKVADSSCSHKNGSKDATGTDKKDDSQAYKSQRQSLTQPASRTQTPYKNQ